MHALLESSPHLREAWYAIELSRHLRSGGLLRKMFFGQPVVIFRGADGGVGALLDRCPHRSVPLSDGKVTAGGGIQCGYHGWEFARSGACVRVPGLCAGCRLPSTAVRSFPVCEKDGIVWLSPAGAAPTASPLPDGLPDPRRFSTFLMAARGEADLTDALENLLDPMHTHFVHRGLIRSEGKRQKVRVTVRRGGDRVEAEYVGEALASGFLARWWEGAGAVSIGRFTLPSTAELEYRNARGGVFILRAFFTPGIEDHLHIVMVVSVRRFAWIPAFVVEWALRPFLRAALRQDRDVLSRQLHNVRSFPDGRISYSELDVLRPHIHLLMREGSVLPLERELEMEL